MFNWLDWIEKYEDAFFGWHLSRWLLIGSVILMGTQMYPGFAALFVMTLNIGLLYLMRWVAKREAIYNFVAELEG